MNDIFASPEVPLFVVITITPLAALLPHNAAADAPLRTCVDSISEGLMSFSLEPSGRQLDLNIGYSVKEDSNLHYGVFFGASQDYGHIKSDNITHSAMSFIKYSF